MIFSCFLASSTVSAEDSLAFHPFSPCFSNVVCVHSVSPPLLLSSSSTDLSKVIMVLKSVVSRSTEEHHLVFKRLFSVLLFLLFLFRQSPPLLLSSPLVLSPSHELGPAVCLEVDPKEEFGVLEME